MTIVKFFFDDFRVDNLGGVSDYHRLSLVIAHLKYQLWELWVAEWWLMESWCAKRKLISKRNHMPARMILFKAKQNRVTSDCFPQPPENPPLQIKVNVPREYQNCCNCTYVILIMWDDLFRRDFSGAPMQKMGSGVNFWIYNPYRSSVWFLNALTAGIYKWLVCRFLNFSSQAYASPSHYPHSNVFLSSKSNEKRAKALTVRFS